jgi:hypothetical protein
MSGLSPCALIVENALPAPSPTRSWLGLPSAAVIVALLPALPPAAGVPPVELAVPVAPPEVAELLALLLEPPAALAVLPLLPPPPPPPPPQAAMSIGNAAMSKRARGEIRIRHRLR